MVRHRLLIFSLLLSMGAGASAQAAKPRYVVEMDGEYGYEVAPTEIDRAQGIATKPLVMVRYKGIIEGKRVIDIRQSYGVEQYYCTGECKYLTYMRITAGSYDKQVIKYDPRTVIGAVVDDMMAGYLKPARK